MITLLLLVPGRAKDYDFHLQMGRATSKMAPHLLRGTELHQQHWVTPEMMNPKAECLFAFTRAAQDQTPLEDIRWQGILTQVVLGYLCILVWFKNAVAEIICHTVRSRKIRPSQSLVSFCFSSTWSILPLAPASFWPWDLCVEGRASLGASSGKPGEPASEFLTSRY